MKWQLYSVQDVPAETVFPPVHYKNRKVALREYSKFLSEKENPEDYRLWFMGWFEDDSSPESIFGVISADPELVTVSISDAPEEM
jgi:hypothetical protein